MGGAGARATGGGLGLPVADEFSRSVDCIGFDDDAGDGDRSFVSAGRARIDRTDPRVALAVAWATLFLVGTDLFVVSPLLPLIAADYGVPSQTAGFTVTGFALSYMVSAPFFGHAADRYGRSRVLSWCLAGFAIANLLSACAGSLEALVVARVLAGCMAAGVTPSIYALVGDHAPSGRRGTWLAIAVSGLLMSLSLGAPLGALAGTSFGWSRVFIAFGAIGAAVLLTNHMVWRKSSPAGEPEEASRPEALVSVQRLGLTVLWSTALYGMYTYLGAGLSGAGFTAEQVAALIFLYGAGAVAGNLVGGHLADRFGPPRVIGLSLFCFSAGLIGLRFAFQMGVLIGPALCLASIAAQLFFPAQQAGIAADFPARRASMLAWNNAALFLGISLGSLIGGQAIAFGGFGMDVAISVVIALAAGLVHSMVCRGSAQPVQAAGKRSLQLLGNVEAAD
jgi:predicted MFS family arabinose efflux permease